jgi:hypothetical protein
MAFAAADAAAVVSEYKTKKTERFDRSIFETHAVMKFG